jgi:transcription-repair coupling factor (superfamily II helicase)
MKLRSWFAPRGVEQLTQLIPINALCRQAHVEKVEAGPKGVIIAFRENSFSNPQGLVRYVAEQGPQAKVRPDMKIVFVRDFETKAARLAGTRQILRTLAAIAAKKAA